MAMELFKRERRVNARMKTCKGRMVRMKGGSGDDGARKKVIKFEFEIPITSKIREMLDARLQALISLDGANEGPEQEFPINKIDPSKQVFPAIINMFSKQNWSADAKPVWTAGSDDPSDQASISLKTIAIKEEEAVLRMEVQVNFTPKIWDWAGDSLDGCDCVMKFKPLSGELFKEQTEEEEGNDDEDVRPASLKNKEKEKETAAAEK